MLKIGIDPSPTSTAMTVNIDDNYFISYSWYQGDIPKWATSITNVVNMIKIEKKVKDSEFSKNEKYKIIYYDELSISLINIIKKYILEHGSNGYSITIEGYSYSSSGSHIFEMVSYGAILRRSLLTISPDLEIIPPASLKTKCAKMAYSTNKDKKGVYRNHRGVPGGSFTKHDILDGLLSYTRDKKITNNFLIWCEEKYDKIINMNKIPYPITDIVDSFWISI